MIKLVNVTKSFNDFKALDDFTLSIEKGSAYGLLGSNGAGKSTLLRLLSGVYRQDSGYVTIGGESVYDNVKLKSRVFFVSDDTSQYNRMTLKGMADFCKTFYTGFSQEKLEKLNSAIGLPMDKELSKFSKGMKRQAVFICALACSTEYLLLDEAFDGLDPTMRLIVKKMLINEMADSGVTVVMSSHALNEIEDFCDTVGLVHKGKLIYSRELDSVKGDIHKVQTCVGDGFDSQALGLDILKETVLGSVSTLIIKGDADEIHRRFIDGGAAFCDIIPLSLEEIFIYEMEGQGYDSSKID